MRKLALSIVLLCVSLVMAGSADASLVVDQHQDLGGGFLGMAYAAPLGQEFVPDVSNLAAVELYISVSGGGAGPAVTVNVREDTITGAIVGTGSISSALTGWNLIDLNADAWLTVGELYVLEFISSSPNGVTRQSGNYYGDGRYIFKGTPQTSGSDLQFRTYYDTEAQAPVPIPGAVWLLGSGLLGLMGVRRAKH